MVTAFPGPILPSCTGSDRKGINGCSRGKAENSFKEWIFTQYRIIYILMSFKKIYSPNGIPELGIYVPMLGKDVEVGGSE